MPWRRLNIWIFLCYNLGNILSVLNLKCSYVIMQCASLWTCRGHWSATLKVYRWSYRWEWLFGVFYSWKFFTNLFLSIRPSSHCSCSRGPQLYTFISRSLRLRKRLINHDFFLKRGIYVSLWVLEEVILLHLVDITHWLL